MLPGFFGTRGDPDRVIRNAFAAGEDGIWVAPRLGGMFQDAALTTPWTADGQPVGGYVDRSPNGYVLTQSTAPARPAGYARRMVFDGSDDFLIASILDLRTRNEFTACVVKFATTVGLQSPWSKSNTSGADGRRSIFRQTGILNAQYDNGPANLAAVADSATTLRVISTVLNRGAGSLVLRINGALADEVTFTPDATDWTISDGYTLGAYWHGVGGWLNGEINEHVHVMRLPVAGEIEAIEQRLIVAHAVETGGG